MKKKIALICLTALCLTACSDDNSEDKVDDMLESYEGESTASSVADKWNGVNYINPNGIYGESAEGFYSYSTSTRRMMFYNKKDGTAIPLCPKVECDHIVPDFIQSSDKEEYTFECDSSYWANNGTQVYNGKLYADYNNVGGEDRVTLLRVNLDGTEKTEVIHNIKERLQRMEAEAEAEDLAGASSSSGYHWFIKDDKFYLVSTIKIGRATTGVTHLYIDIYDINTGDLLQEFLHKEIECEGTAYLHGVEIIEEKIIMGLSIESESMDLGGNIPNQYPFYSIDINTGEMEEIVLEKSEYSTQEFYKDGLLYQKKGGDIYFINSDEEQKLCIELNSIEKERGVYIRYIGDYIYISLKDGGDNSSDSDESYVKIYDKEFKYIDTIATPETVIVRAGHNQLLMESMESFEKYYYVDAEAIGTGDAEVKEYVVK